MFFAVLFNSYACGRLSAAPFIIEEGKPKAEIVIAEEPLRPVKLAAKELQDYLRKMTGAELPVTTVPSKDVPVQIYVGKSSSTETLGISDKGLDHGAFRIVSGKNWLVLLGHDTNFTPIKPYAEYNADIPRMMEEWDKRTGEKWGNPTTTVYKFYNKDLDIWYFDERGTFNAVSQYLRDLGVRWYMPGELGEVVPHKKTIELPAVDKTVRPDFALRDIGYGLGLSSKEFTLWRLRLGLSPAYELFGSPSIAHGLNYVHDREEVKKAHPEYYTLSGKERMVNGMRDGLPCLSSKGLFEETVKYARKIFEIYDPPIIGIMPNDGYTVLCQCELCKEKGTPERGWTGQLSDYVWDFVNRVAIELNKSNPDKKVISFAYGTYLMPPEKIKTLSPNLVVGMVQPRAGFDDAEKRERFLKIREGFLNKLPSKELYIWDHYLQSRPGSPYESLPSIFPRLIAQDLKSLKGISRGEVIELSQDRGSTMHAPGINHLNVYVTSRLYWDADQNLDAMLDEYYRLFYGPAATEMKELYDLTEAHWRNLEPKEIDEIFHLFDIAEKASGRGVYGERIALLRKETESKMKQRYLQKAATGEVIQLSFLDEKGIDPLAVESALPKAVLREILDGEQPAINTTVSLGWTGDSLFLRIICEEPEMDHLRTLAHERDDTNIFNDDSVEIVLKTPGHSYFQFTINSDGQYADLDRAVVGLEGIYWDAKGIEIRTEKLKDRWIAWVRIPATALKADEPTEENPWQLNIGRVRPREEGRELTLLAPAGRPTFHDLKKMIRIYYKKLDAVPDKK